MDAKEYEPGPLVDAVTGLDLDFEHARHAIRAIQETVFKETGEELSDIGAIKVLGRLVEAPVHPHRNRAASGRC